MISTRTAVLLVLLGGAACAEKSAGTAPPAAPATAPADDQASAAVIEHHRFHHHGGVTLFVAMSLDTLGVAPEQQAAVEKVRAKLRADIEPTRLAERDLVAKLADGVAAAKLDPARVEVAVGRVSAAASAARGASTEALDELHAVLTSEQRAALVDKVEAHWAVWRQANADETAAAKAEDGHLAALADELDLSAEQVDKIRANLTDEMKSVPRLDPDEVAAHLRGFGDAFRADSFDAKALAGGVRADTHIVGWGAAHLAHFIEAANPVLTPDQRTELAQRLREHTSHTETAQVNP